VVVIVVATAAAVAVVDTKAVETAAVATIVPHKIATDPAPSTSHNFSITS
jgi:hypothetical protein